MSRRRATALSWFASCAAALSAAPARAQTVQALDEDARNAAYARFGADWTPLSVAAGYARRFGRAETSAHVLVPAVAWRDTALQIGARTFVGFDRWRSPLEIAVSGRSARNRVMTAWGLSGSLGAAPGYYGDRLALAADLGLEIAALTHVKHSSLYRDSYHPNAIDGWYKGSARSWSAGARAAWRFGPSWGITLRAGTRWSGPLGGLLPGIYATGGSEFSF